MSTLTPGGKDSIGSVADCGTWNGNTYQYRAPAGMVDCVVVRITDTGFTAVEPVLIEHIHTQSNYIFRPAS
jgi:hypothetical protein